MDGTPQKSRTGVPGEEKECSAEKVFEEIMAENSPMWLRSWTNLKQGKPKEIHLHNLTAEK